MKTVYAHENELVPTACGIGAIGGFDFVKGDNEGFWWSSDPDPVTKVYNQGGANWCISSFVEADEGESKTAYLHLKKRWPIVFQSPVRVNTNSDNQFFFCLYDTESGADKSGNVDKEWPFGEKE